MRLALAFLLAAVGPAWAVQKSPPPPGCKSTLGILWNVVLRAEARTPNGRGLALQSWADGEPELKNRHATRHLTIDLDGKRWLSVRVAEDRGTMRWDIRYDKHSLLMQHDGAFRGSMDGRALDFTHGLDDIRVVGGFAIPPLAGDFDLVAGVQRLAEQAEQVAKSCVDQHGRPIFFRDDPASCSECQAAGAASSGAPLLLRATGWALERGPTAFLGTLVGLIVEHGFCESVCYRFK